MPNRFGIYVHIPFCIHKCSYCDFYSFTRFEPADFFKWQDRVLREVEESASWLGSAFPGSRKVSSIFFGGGTPSLVPTKILGSVFKALSGSFPFDEGIEITLEANPETVTPEFCDGLMAHTPVNRVSLGAQSFQAVYLEKLERTATAESVVRAVSLLRAAGVENLNLDLIFAIPGQSLEESLDDIREAIRLKPNHLSFYNLSLKPGHSLFTKLPSDDFSADLYEAGVRLLENEGYLQYEISNFARAGLASRHNILYWSGGDYLGLGPSAASRIFGRGVFHHRKALSDFSRYLDSNPFSSEGWEPNTQGQTLLEATFLELRQNEGVHLGAFRDRYAYDLTEAKNFPLFLREGLIDREGEWLKLTARGRLLADRVTQDLVD